MAEITYPWHGEIEIDLGLGIAADFRAEGQHAIRDGISSWAVFLTSDGPSSVEFTVGERVRLSCDGGPWTDGTYQGVTEDEDVVPPQIMVDGVGSAPFPSDAPPRFRLLREESEVESAPHGSLVQEAGAIETARQHLNALRAEVDRLLAGETKGLEDGLLGGLVVELDELADYIDGRLAAAPSRADLPRSVAKALEFLRRAANLFAKSKAAEALKLAREIAMLLADFGINVDLGTS